MRERGLLVLRHFQEELSKFYLWKKTEMQYRLSKKTCPDLLLVSGD